MSKPIIQVQNLSKFYRIKHLVDSDYATLTETMASFFRKKQMDPAAGELAREEQFKALDDVSFEVNPGDRVGIIGRNGAGKSTLLKLLTRITEPSAGRFIMRGHAASLLEVGTGFHPELNGRENIYLNGAILGLKRAEIKHKFDEIVDFSGVEKFLDTPVKRYSSGMYVRLAFAVAAHLESEILLVDEVLAVGDMEFQKKCLGKMNDISTSEGRTILFVSHNIGAMEKLCNRGLLFQSGKIALDGSIKSCVSRYIGSEDVHQHIFSPEEMSNEFVHVDKVSIHGKSVDSMLKFYSDQPLKIQIQITVRKENPYVTFPFLHLYDDEGNCIFAINSNKRMEKTSGTYLAKTEIPANFLNNKSFRMGVGVSFSEENCRLAHMVPDLFDAGVLSFAMQEPLSAQELRYGWTGDFPGSTHPLLDFSIKNVNEVNHD